MKRFVLLTMLTVVISLLFLGCSNNNSESVSDEVESDSSSSIEILANCTMPDEDFICLGMKEYSEKVKEETEGKVQINVRTGGALGLNGPENLKAIRDNRVPISDYLFGQVLGDEPRFAMSMLPFLKRDYDEVKTFNEVTRSYYEEIAENDWNQKVIYASPWPYQSFWTNTEIKSLDDIKNTKLRTAGELTTRAAQVMGATPQTIPFGELHSALSTGVIDSVVTSTPSAVDGKFWELLKYYTPTNLNANTTFIAMNLDEFNKLDEEIQDILINVGDEMNEIMRERFKEAEREALETVKENGIIVNEPSDDLMNALYEIGDIITQEWIDDAPTDAQEMLNKYLEEVDH